MLYQLKQSIIDLYSMIWDKYSARDDTIIKRKSSLIYLDLFYPKLCSRIIKIASSVYVVNICKCTQYNNLCYSY